MKVVSVILPLTATVAGVFLAIAGYLSSQASSIDVPASVQALFTKWTANYGKAYSTPQEYAYRVSVFYKNYLHIEELNRQYSYTSGTNQFADMTPQEFKAAYGNSVRGASPTTDPKINRNYGADPKPPPASWDWRQFGVVNQIKNAGSCGASYAFATVSTVESDNALWNNKLYSLSEQQVVDCSNGFGNHGCSGGDPQKAYFYMTTVALETESAYPYQGQAQKCKYAANKGVVNLTAWYNVKPNNCTQVLGSVLEGPTDVAIVSSAIQFYTGGVFNSTTCGSNTDYDAVIVGYGTDPTSQADYWIVRPSFGASYGEQGYIRMDRNVQSSTTGICGICTYALGPFPITPF